MFNVAQRCVTVAKQPTLLRISGLRLSVFCCNNNFCLANPAWIIVTESWYQVVFTVCPWRIREATPTVETQSCGKTNNYRYKEYKELEHNIITQTSWYQILSPKQVDIIKSVSAFISFIDSHLFVKCLNINSSPVLVVCENVWVTIRKGSKLLLTSRRDHFSETPVIKSTSTVDWIV